jgi:hypothetical protein
MTKKLNSYTTVYQIEKENLIADCPVPVKTDVGQVDLVLRLSDGTSEKIRFPYVPVRQTHLFPLV